MNVKIDGKIFEPENVLFPRTKGFDVIKNCVKDEYEGVLDSTFFCKSNLNSIGDDN